MKFKIFKNIRCKIGLHNWKTVKSMKISNLVIILKIRTPILKKVNIDYGPDGIIRNRKCIDCKTKDYELDHARIILKKKMLDKIEMKIHSG